MNENRTDKTESYGNALFSEWILFETQMLGSRKAVALRIGKHENTLSRILNNKQTVSEETILALRQAFELTENDYRMGPGRFHKKSLDQPFDPDRLTQVYPLRFLGKNPCECSRSWSVWSHQHKRDYDSYIHVYVDMDGFGLAPGTEAVVHLNNKPKDNQMTLNWKEDSQGNVTAYFAPWDSSSSSTDTLIGVVEYLIQ